MARLLASACLALFCAVEAKLAHIEHVSIRKFRHGTPEEREEQVGLLRKAFENQGMVVLVDHDVPQDTIQNVIGRSRDFFSLPLERKQQFPVAEGYPPRSYAAITTPKGKGYMLQQQDDDGNILNEWLLVRNSSVAIDDNDPYYGSDEGREFYSKEEKHPEQQRWPEEVPGLKEATEAYYSEVEGLAHTMYELFALALRVNVDFFTSRAKHSAIWPVTIAHYPAQSKQPAEGQMRIQPHWDRTLFSLITSSDTGDDVEAGGLQILVDAETGVGVDGRAAKLEGRQIEWQDVTKPAGSFVVNVGEMMSRWSNGRLRHVVHRVPNPQPNNPSPGRISIMAYVLPDYDATVECILCEAEGTKPMYEKTWVGEMMNWGSDLPIYNKTRQELMRMAQGLYTASGAQTALGDPTDVNAIAEELAQRQHRGIAVVDVAPLLSDGASPEAQLEAARALSAAFEDTGFAVVVGHGLTAESVRALRSAAFDFFHSPAEEKARFDKGKGYGFGGYVNQSENGAQLLGDFSRPNDAVESLTLRRASGGGGVEAVQLGDAKADGSEGSCSASGPGGCEMAEDTPEVLRAPTAAFLREAAALNTITTKAIQLALGVTNDELASVIDPVVGGVRLAYYPAQQEPAAPGQMRYGSHIDSAGITVVSLDPDSAAGLQVDISRAGNSATEDDRVWLDVPFVPGSFVFNVGALLSRWTGGRWKASIHRVMADTVGTERLSVITGALTPRTDGPAFSGFASCVGATPPEPVTAKEYLASRVALHRPEYRKEAGLASSEALEAEADRIRKLTI